MAATKRKRKVNSETVLHGTVMNYNASLQQRYKKALRQLVDQMVDETQKEIARLFDTKKVEKQFAQDASVASMVKKALSKLIKKFTGLFASKANDMAKAMVEGTEKTSNTGVKSSLKKLSGNVTLKTGVVSEGYETIAKAIVDTNVSYIKMIAPKYFDQISGAVYRSITSNEPNNLTEEIYKYGRHTKEAANLLALDQTRKAYNAINARKLQDIGVSKFVWRHSSAGQKPRPSHVRISGETFSFANLQAEQAALNVPEADRGLPGFPVNCRCRIQAVINFEEL